MHSKIYVSRFAKTTYNLERREQLKKIFPPFQNVDRFNL
jgi:hypothetical protein